MTTEAAWILGLLVGLALGLPVGILAGEFLIPRATDRIMALLAQSIDDRGS